MVEMNSDEILRNAEKEDVVFLVAGDPVAATTHSDLILRAKNRNIKTRIVHNASIFNAVACCGLQVSGLGLCLSRGFTFIVTYSELLDSIVVQFRRNRIYSVLDRELETGQLCRED